MLRLPGRLSTGRFRFLKSLRLGPPGEQRVEPETVEQEKERAKGQRVEQETVEQEKGRAKGQRVEQETVEQGKENVRRGISDLRSQREAWVRLARNK